MKPSFINPVVFLLMGFSFFAACNYQLNTVAKAWNPYKRLDMLIFESDKHQTDTIFVNQVQEYEQEGSQILKVNCEFLRIKNDNAKRQSWLLSITSRDNANAVMNINFNTSYARLAPFGPKRISWLDSIPWTKKEIYGVTYKDLLVLEPDISAADFENHAQDSLFVKQLLWSKTKGIVSFQLKDDTRWILTKKSSL